MKLKSNVITGLVIVCFLLGGITTLRAQGIFSDDNNNTTAANTASSNDGGLFRDAPGGSGDGKDPAPGTNPDETPVGEGIAILSLLSGVYAVVKRNIKNKNED